MNDLFRPQPTLIKTISSCLLAAGLAAAAHAQVTFTNVALSKHTEQSTPTGWGGVPSRAVDGDTSGVWSQGSVTHTDIEHGPWWTVDLEGKHYVDRVVVWNRTDCCSTRLSNFYVELLDEAGEVIDLQFSSSSPNPSQTFNFSTGGVFNVRVRLEGFEILSLAEVQVYGTPLLLSNELSGYVTADNVVEELYLNGQSVGTLPHASAWEDFDRIQDLLLQPGTNVLAAKVKDSGGPAGFIADLVVGGYRTGTSSSWKVTHTNPGPGWQAVSFNDSGWSAATVHGEYGDGPWHSRVTGFPESTSAQWIWSSDNVNHNDLYLRYEFVANPPQVSTATYNATLGAPECDDFTGECDSAGLLNSKANLNVAEPNQPNSLDSCADGTSGGTYHLYESIDKVTVRSTDTVQLTEGKTAEIEVTWWAYNTSNYVDFYYAADAKNPTWTYIDSVQAGSSGLNTHKVPYTLPQGHHQAVRASLRWGLGGSQPAACQTGAYGELDDLAFAVSSGFGHGVGRAAALMCPGQDPEDCLVGDKFLPVSARTVHNTAHYDSFWDYFTGPNFYPDFKCLGTDGRLVDCVDGHGAVKEELLIDTINHGDNHDWNPDEHYAVVKCSHGDCNMDTFYIRSPYHHHWLLNYDTAWLYHGNEYCAEYATQSRHWNMWKGINCAASHTGLTRPYRKTFLEDVWPLVLMDATSDDGTHPEPFIIFTCLRDQDLSGIANAASNENAVVPPVGAYDCHADRKTMTAVATQFSSFDDRLANAESEALFAIAQTIEIEFFTAGLGWILKSAAALAKLSEGAQAAARAIGRWSAHAGIDGYFLVSGVMELSDCGSDTTCKEIALVQVGMSMLAMRTGVLESGEMLHNMQKILRESGSPAVAEEMKPFLNGVKQGFEETRGKAVEPLPSSTPEEPSGVIADPEPLPSEEILSCPLI